MIFFKQKDLRPDAEMPEDVRKVLENDMAGRGSGRTMSTIILCINASAWEHRKMSAFGSKWRKIRRGKK